jgi:hypothetical protein
MAAGEPDSFFHLTEEERIFVAKSRISKTKRQLSRLIKLDAQTRSLLDTPIHRVKTEIYGEAPQILFQSVLSEHVIQLCRLWDKFDANGFSIPTIGTLLRDREVWKALELGNTVKQRKEKLRKLTQALKLIVETDQSDELRTIRNLRHKRAHPIFRTRDERKAKIESPKAAHLRYVLERATDCIPILDEALGNEAEDYTSLKDVAEKNARAFFSALSMKD